MVEPVARHVPGEQVTGSSVRVIPGKRTCDEHAVATGARRFIAVLQDTGPGRPMPPRRQQTREPAPHAARESRWSRPVHAAKANGVLGAPASGATIVLASEGR